MIYQFKQFSKLNLSNAKAKLYEHYEKVGLYENFGQEVINYLKSKYEYNIYSHEPKMISICNQINALDNWCINFVGQTNK